MFSGFHSMAPSDAELATHALSEEGSFRFPSFSASDAVTLGLSLRKRFRGTSRYVKGKGLVISIQTIAGHTLFACTVGDLGHTNGIGDVSLDSWSCIEGMVSVVRRTGHSSFYVEKGMSAMGKTPKQMGIQGELCVNGGDDHNLVVSTIRDYLNKLARENGPPPPTMPASMTTQHESKEWSSEPVGPSEHIQRIGSPFEQREEH
ncbi:hypothetical protein C0989_001483 [Termitomyces sp. Mn162]|nr:hypothetical protein C0989_001483 [Termitomyces sp. Mn162]